MGILRRTGEGLVAGTGIGLAAAALIFAGDHSNDVDSHKDIRACAATLGPVAVKNVPLEQVSQACIGFDDMLRHDGVTFDLPSQGEFPGQVKEYVTSIHAAARVLEEGVLAGGALVGVLAGVSKGITERRTFNDGLQAILAEAV